MKLKLLLFSVVFCNILVAQKIKHKNKWGEDLYFIKENQILLKDSWGEAQYYFDIENNLIKKKDKWGESLFYIDGNQIKIKDKWGDDLYFIDGNTIKYKDKWGDDAFYIDGQTIKLKDKWGEELYYFDQAPKIWMIIAVCSNIPKSQNIKAKDYFGEIKFTLKVNQIFSPNSPSEALYTFDIENNQVKQKNISGESLFSLKEILLN